LILYKSTNILGMVFDATMKSITKKLSS